MPGKTIQEQISFIPYNQPKKRHSFYKKNLPLFDFVDRASHEESFKKSTKPFETTFECKICKDFGLSKYFCTHNPGERNSYQKRKDLEPPKDDRKAIVTIPKALFQDSVNEMISPANKSVKKENNSQQLDIKSCVFSLAKELFNSPDLAPFQTIVNCPRCSNTHYTKIPECLKIYSFYKTFGQIKFEEIEEQVHEAIETLSNLDPGCIWLVQNSEYCFVSNCFERLSGRFDSF